MEVVLTFAEKADRQTVITWFQSRGISATPMRAGLLLTGKSADFVRVLGSGDPEFTVPAALKSHVSSITWHRPPTLM